MLFAEPEDIDCYNNYIQNLCTRNYFYSLILSSFELCVAQVLVFISRLLSVHAVATTSNLSFTKGFILTIPVNKLNSSFLPAYVIPILNCVEIKENKINRYMFLNGKFSLALNLLIIRISEHFSKLLS